MLKDIQQEYFELTEVSSNNLKQDVTKVDTASELEYKQPISMNANGSDWQIKSYVKYYKYLTIMALTIIICAAAYNVVMMPSQKFFMNMNDNEMTLSDQDSEAINLETMVSADISSNTTQTAPQVVGDTLPSKTIKVNEVTHLQKANNDSSRSVLDVIVSVTDISQLVDSTITEPMLKSKEKMEQSPFPEIKSYNLISLPDGGNALSCVDIKGKKFGINLDGLGDNLTHDSPIIKQIVSGKAFTDPSLINEGEFSYYLRCSNYARDSDVYRIHYDSSLPTLGDSGRYFGNWVRYYATRRLGCSHRFSSVCLNCRKYAKWHKYVCTITKNFQTTTVSSYRELVYEKRSKYDLRDKSGNLATKGRFRYEYKKEEANNSIGVSHEITRTTTTGQKLSVNIGFKNDFFESGISSEKTWTLQQKVGKVTTHMSSTTVSDTIEVPTKAGTCTRAHMKVYRNKSVQHWRIQQCLYGWIQLNIGHGKKCNGHYYWFFPTWSQNGVIGKYSCMPIEGVSTFSNSYTTEFKEENC